MTLSCECDFDFGEGAWWHEPPDDFAPLATKRRQRCMSCKKLIDLLADAGRFQCLRFPRSFSIEEKIVGQDNMVYMADRYMCEVCTGFYFSLTDLGFCVSLGEDMRELVKEYAKVYGKGACDDR